MFPGILNSTFTVGADDSRSAIEKRGGQRRSVDTGVGMLVTCAWQRG